MIEERERNAGNDLSLFEVRVQSRLHGRVRDFQLLQRDGGLILRGYARTYYAKQLAQQAVLEEGLSVMANEIQVG